ncbi:hypothetical protein DW322_18480 [Rhodococcus rhodnii]|uniref:Capsule synthesis protein CapA domain-containing protein n=2 Tax=Rhodococcus rhodnii TaxID=38312 RepID=R7WQ89_9NOCA|nr:CapA family protein [Rhodococcus rhodnii]EOM76159.1 hypothetical protein Rrhod_2525 [Rhodococcus rhodnii LMG 5362]TXG91806.1 hypothetical protein DW322_18480 [Rhodococcus rhodnii]
MNGESMFRRDSHGWLAPAVATVVVLGVGVAAAAYLPGRAGAGGDDAMRGTVVDETGAPVADATIRVGGHLARTDADGMFALPTERPGLASAQAPGRLARTQAVSPGEPTRIELTSDADASAALRFGGDVSFAPADGAADPGTAGDHADALAAVAPLLQDADVAVVNLETPLVTAPPDPVPPRRAPFHPTKASVVASAPEAAQALRISGVDVVSLANDHVFDALESGVDSTVAALDLAGVAHFGAGRTADEAWQPAIVRLPSGSVAFVGCTTVDGDQHEIPYVARDDRAGAAECSTTRIERAVRDAREAADTVVVVLHGGVQGEREQSPTIRRMADAAAHAGAAIVVGGHPRVTGGLRTVGETVIAESTGTLLDAAAAWSSVPSHLVRVDVRGGAAVHASADPLVLVGGRPVPVTGALADSASRIAAGSVDGAARLMGAGAELAPTLPAPVRQAAPRVPPGEPRRLGPGWFVASAGPGVRVGTDLLWGSGRFDDAAPAPGDAAGLWELGDAARTTPTAGCAGDGLELVRSPLSTEDVYATPAGRVDVARGQHLSLLADVRSASPGSILEIRWYDGASGHSIGSDDIAVPERDRTSGGCAEVRLDAVVPPGAVAAQPFVRLNPPGDAVSGPRLAVDDVRLVSWAPEGSAGRRFDTVETTRSVTVAVTGDAEGPAEPFADEATWSRQEVTGS